MAYMRINKNSMTLKDLEIGKSAVITAVGGEGALRQHFLDMGMIPGAEVTAVKLAPMGDPMELRIHGYELTIRIADAEKIHVVPADPDTKKESVKTEIKKTEHPGLGETGKYHNAKEEEVLPDGTKLSFALIGNQNCGKTTLFNQLTGSNQHVGNFPGVTVDRKDGVIKGYPNTIVTDLPGIYSMSPYTSEEIVSRNFVLQEKPTAIINIVDATNIERNLYLTMQLLEMNIPMVVALNMMDEVHGNGGYIDVNAMEQLLGVPVIPISAAKNQGIDELVRHAVHIAYYQEKPLRQDYCDENDHKGAVHRCLHAIRHLIQDHAEDSGLPLNFASSKVVEGDELILEGLKLEQNEIEMLEHMVAQMEKERNLDRSAAIADMRFSFIFKVCSQTVVKARESKEHMRSRKIENIIDEAKQLAEVGVKELIVIAQDTTSYGLDLYGELKLPELLNELCEIDGIEWIRLLYCYPDRITDELIATIKNQEKIVNYIDLPLQHANDRILKAMNRRGTSEDIRNTIEKLRKEIPDVVIRTTFIVGFPGEDDEAFEDLATFVNEIEFDRLGCFSFSPQEGTPAYDMDDQLEDDVKLNRGDIIMQDQLAIMEEKNNAKIGKTYKTIVEEYDSYSDSYIGRTYMDAPEIDSVVKFTSTKNLEIGDFADVRIFDFDEYDLLGEVR